MAEAGARGAITVSTQMAGRGTDIRLGGTGGDRDEVAALGGLLVIGMGRHASSRLDHQLRGRSGRQGDPGGSVFFLSMEDELITTCVPDAEPPADGGPDGRVHRPEGALDGRPRPAGGRGRAPADPPGHLAVQHAPGGPAADRAGSTATSCCAPIPRCARWRSPSRNGPPPCATRVPEEVLAEAARQISLAQLDQAWAEYLAQAADLREGIHLRALGHGPNPFGGSLNPVRSTTAR